MDFKARIDKIITEKCNGIKVVFSKKIKVHISTIEKWDDAHIPSGKILHRINDVFHVDLNWLLTGEGSPYIIEDHFHDQVKVSDDVKIEMRGLDGRIRPEDSSIVDSGGERYHNDIGHAVGDLVKILSSGDKQVADAILSNLKTFSAGVDLKSQIRDLRDEVSAFRAEFLELKEKLAKIERVYIEEAAHKPLEIQERRAFHFKLGQILDGDNLLKKVSQ